MSLAITLARRSLLQRPGRTLFSILGVAVGIATVVAVFTVDHVTLKSRTFVDNRWKADLEVRAGRDVQDPRGTLRGTEGVTDVAAFFQNDAMFRPRVGPGERSDPERVQMVALDAGTGQAIGAYHVIDGADLAPDAAENQVLIGSGLAREHDLKPGDELYLSRPRRGARKVCREGEVQVVESRDVPVEEAFTIVGVITNDGVGRKALGRIVVVDYQVGRELYRGAFVDPRFWIRRDPNVDIENLGASLGQSFSYELNSSVVVGQMEDERAFRNGVHLAGFLALTLGLYVIFHTLSMSLRERVREVAVLHALGTARRQIARVFFLEALIIAVAAGVLGFVGGLGLARLLLKQGITTLGVVENPVNIFSVPWTIVLPLSLLGIAIALLGSVYPLMRARRSDTVSTLRGEDLLGGGQASLARGFHIFTAILLIGVLPVIYFSVAPVVGAAEATLVGPILACLGVAALLIALPLIVPSVVGLVCGSVARFFERTWPLAGKLAARSIEQGPSRIAASVAAIALVTAAFVGLKGMTNSLRAEVETWGQEAVVDKVFVSGLPNVKIDGITAELSKLPEVIGVESGDTRSYVPFLMIGVRPGQLRGWGPCKENPNLIKAMRERQGMIVSERLARHRNIDVGDTLAINTSGHGVQTFRVAAVTDEYGYFTQPDERMYGVVDDALMDRYFCLDATTTTRLAVRLRDGADPDVVQAAIFGKLPEGTPPDNMRFIQGREVLDYHVADISRDFLLFDIILGLTALLAAIGVLNGQLLAALERAKELGVLRALGTTRRQVAGMVLLESSVLGVTGGLLGLVFGSALTPIVVKALRMMSGLPLPHRSAGPYLAWCLLGALVVTALAGVYPIWRMNRLDAVRAVRTG